MSLTVKANAKINLTLHITGKRPDGYHTLDTIMQSLQLGDLITLNLTNDCQITVTCSVPELAGEKNLVYKAAQTFFKALGSGSAGVSIAIDKHIPMAAGLGGGSADAAAVLAGLNRLHGEPFSTEELQKMALPLGADVPFCLVGGTCLAQGIGEVLTPLVSRLTAGLILIKPCDKGSTGEMYQKYDKIKGLSAANNCDIIDGIGTGDRLTVANHLYNDFLPLYEGQAISGALTALKQAGALGAGLSGSGPTVFGLFEDIACAKTASEQLAVRYSGCLVTEFSSRGWELL